MRADIERLRLRMVAEVEREWCRAGLTAKQEGDRGAARRVAFERFDDGAPQSGGTMLLEQFQQLSGLTAGRFALREGEVKQRFAFWYGLFQPAARRGVEGLALDLENRLLMRGMEHLLVAIIGARVAGDLR